MKKNFKMYLKMWFILVKSRRKGRMSEVMRNASNKKCRKIVAKKKRITAIQIDERKNKSATNFSHNFNTEE